LAAALVGLQQKLQQIDEQIAAVRSLKGAPRRGRPPKVAGPASDPAPKKRRTLSDEAKKRIAEGQKKRWAAFRKEKRG
jgi:hypothetical protein